MTSAWRDDDRRSRCCARCWKIGKKSGVLDIRDDVLSIRIEPDSFRSDFPSVPGAPFGQSFIGDGCADANEEQSNSRASKYRIVLALGKLSS